MIYNVLMGTLNPTHSLTHSLTHYKIQINFICLMQFVCHVNVSLLLTVCGERASRINIETT